MTKEDTKAAKAYAAYEKVINVQKEKEDSRGLRLVEELVHKIAEYSKIVAQQSTLKVRNAAGQLEDNRLQELQQLDQLRSIVHNALISQLHIVTRYLTKNYRSELPLAGIYSFDISTIKDRQKVGEWALLLADALFRRDIIKQ